MSFNSEKTLFFSRRLDANVSANGAINKQTNTQTHKHLCAVTALLPAWQRSAAEEPFVPSAPRGTQPCHPPARLLHRSDPRPPASRQPPRSSPARLCRAGDRAWLSSAGQQQRVQPCPKWEVGQGVGVTCRAGNPPARDQPGKERGPVMTARGVMG